MSPSRVRNMEKERDQMRLYRKNNPEKLREMRHDHYLRNKERIKAEVARYKAAHPDQRKIADLKRFYGLTIEERDALFASQDGLCAICGTDTPEGNGWHIDHDHKTKRVRGILCTRCNTVLGMAKDNIETLRAAIEYLGR